MQQNQSNHILEEAKQWVITEINSEYQYLSSKEKKFFNAYRLQSPTLYELQNKTPYDDSMFVVFKYKNHVILMDDIEELFSVGELKDNKLIYEGNFTSLKDTIHNLCVEEQENTIDKKIVLPLILIKKALGCK